MVGGQHQEVDTPEKMQWTLSLSLFGHPQKNSILHLCCPNRIRTKSTFFFSPGNWLEPISTRARDYLKIAALPLHCATPSSLHILKLNCTCISQQQLVLPSHHAHTQHLSVVAIVFQRERRYSTKMSASDRTLIALIADEVSRTNPSSSSNATRLVCKKKEKRKRLLTFWA